MRRKSDMSGKRSEVVPNLHASLPFFDRERESRRIAGALRMKESMMIGGPAGIGKTALILNVIHHLPDELARQCLYLAGFKNLQDLLRKLLQTLYQAKNPELRKQLHAEGVSVVNFDVRLKALSSSRLKGTLYRAVEKTEYRVILDHVPPLTHAIAKVIKELFWMRNTPVYLLIRDDREHRIEQFTGFFYWGDREQLRLGPLPVPSARELLDCCIEQFGLSRLELEDFREEVLELSACVPRAIVKMCELAADPRYQYGSRIKTKLVHIDYLMSTQHFRPSERNPPIIKRD